MVMVLSVEAGMKAVRAFCSKTTRPTESNTQSPMAADASEGSSAAARSREGKANGSSEFSRDFCQCQASAVRNERQIKMRSDFFKGRRLTLDPG